MNDHIPDVTKMISDTPRTDAEAFYPHDSKYKVCDADFARILERELNAANAEIEEKRKDVVWLATEKAKLADRIKRLEEAKKTIDDLKLRVKRDFETILKFKAENEWLIKKIEQLYEVAEQQKRTIKELEEVNEYLRQKNDKLEYGRTSK